MSAYDIPFVPSSDDSVSTMVKLARVMPGERAVDLGSGDGRLIIALAHRGVRATGVEIDDGRWQLTNSAIRMQRLEGLARVIHGSFWKQDLSPYDIIVLYGIPSIMERLERKIINEAKDNCRVVSNRFQFPNWKPVKVKSNVYRYDLATVRQTA